MSRLFTLLCIVISSLSTTVVIADIPITKIKVVEKLCRDQSSEFLEEQGIKLTRWQAQTFNGDRTFNIEGRWITSSGLYLVECELPFGSDKSVLTLEITKE